MGGGACQECYIVASENGLDWNQVTCPADARSPNHVIAVNGVFYAVGGQNAATNATVLTSSDGLNWTSWNTGAATFTYETIAYNFGSFYVAAGTGGGVDVSSDPTSIAFTDAGTGGVNLNNIAVAGSGAMLAVNGTGVVRYTADGSAWSTPGTIFTNAPSGEGPFAVTAFGDGFLTGGGNINTNDSCFVDSSADGFNYSGGYIMDPACTGDAGNGFAIFRQGLVRGRYWSIGQEVQSGVIDQTFIAYAADPTSTPWDYVFMDTDLLFDLHEISGD